VGDYRVVYTIDDVKLRVSVTRIRHRSEVYEG
jgi:mRNA-degrading endonuclease RelE of RelBE toxin-antitoxin system